MVQPFHRQIIQFEFSPTWSCVSLTKIIQIRQNGGQLFSNLADCCHILSLTHLKGGTWCANKKNLNIFGTGG